MAVLASYKKKGLEDEQVILGDKKAFDALVADFKERGIEFDKAPVSKDITDAEVKKIQDEAVKAKIAAKEEKVKRQALGLPV